MPHAGVLSLTPLHPAVICTKTHSGSLPNPTPECNNSFSINAGACSLLASAGIAGLLTCSSLRSRWHKPASSDQRPDCTQRPLQRHMLLASANLPQPQPTLKLDSTY